MPLEIEAKFRLHDIPAMRRRLAEVGGQTLGAVLEHNTFYDTAGESLRRADCGLRIRTVHTADGQSRSIMTYKGPRRPGPMKIRQEDETPVEAAAAAAILAALGYTPRLTFQKRRESYWLAGAKVEIDELPQLGFFLEIEAPDEATVHNVRALLELDGEPMIAHPYTAIIAEHLAKTSVGRCELRFANA